MATPQRSVLGLRGHCRFMAYVEGVPVRPGQPRARVAEEVLDIAGGDGGAILGDDIGVLVNLVGLHGTAAPGAAQRRCVQALVNESRD